MKTVPPVRDAQFMGAAQLLQETLDEEAAANQQMTALAVTVNREASAAT